MRLYQNKYPVSDKAKYVCDYVYDNPQGQENYYYQLVRIKDDAILCAFKDKRDIIVRAWELNIRKEEVSFI